MGVVKQKKKMTPSSAANSLEWSHVGEEPDGDSSSSSLTENIELDSRPEDNKSNTSAHADVLGKDQPDLFESDPAGDIGEVERVSESTPQNVKRRVSKKKVKGMT